jgi:glycosyltransferase involved in cell wall biosynthesis
MGVRAELRVLHANCIGNPSSGVLYQLRAEQRSAEELGLPWSVSLWTNTKTSEPFAHFFPRPFSGDMARRFFFSREMRRRIKEYDVLLVRYVTADPFFAFFLDGTRPCLTVHHTKEIDEIAAGARSFKWRAALAMERFWGSKTLGRVDGIIGVTEEILKYERSRAGCPVPGFVLPNGISLADVSLAPDKRGRGPIQIAFVASFFAPWHGLDKVLSVLQDFSEPVMLHLVGTVPDRERDLIARHPRLRSQVLLHGLLDRNALATVLEECDCTLSSFALERKSMCEATTLKVRESLAAGIPVLSGHRDSAFPEEFPFYRNIEIRDLPEALETVKKWREVPRDRVRSLAAPFIDKKEILRSAYHKLLDLFS